MGWLGLFSILLLVIAVAAIDDDLEFESDVVSPSSPLESSTSAPVKRLWGVPDTQAIAGKLFHASIPSDAFAGDVDYFESAVVRGKTWPAWLEINKNGVMKGVPSLEDVGVKYVMVRAVGPHSQHSSRDVFAIEVIKPGLDNIMTQNIKAQCPSGVDPIMLSILMDVEVKDIEPKQRISIIETIASYFGLPQELFYLRGLTTPRDLLSLADATVLMVGPGNVITAKDKDFASLSFQIGCGRDIRKEMEPVIERIKSDAKDGTLAEVIQLPVVGWHARNELPAFFRDRREVGSGDFYGEDEEDDDYGENLTTVPTPNRHRHHHGEDDQLNSLGGYVDPDLIQPSEVFYHKPPTSLLVNYDTIISTPAFFPERPTINIDATAELLPTRVTEIDLTHTTSPDVVYTETDRSSHQPVTVHLSPTKDDNVTESTSDVPSDFSSPTQPISTYGGSSSSTSPSSNPSTSSRSGADTTIEGISVETGSSVLNHSMWTTPGTTEEMEPETRNFPPNIASRLKKVAVVAGKLLRFKIPDNTFFDVEDQWTPHLDISFTTVEGKPLGPNEWIMFNGSTREIIALPLEEHVSKWDFIVTATDKDGDSVSDKFELQVQQHKGTRTVNHEMNLKLSVQRERGFDHALDWQLKTLDALIKVYGDADSSHITVRRVTLGDPVSFIWTNDSLPKSPCPREKIEGLMKVIANDDGYPSSALIDSFDSRISVQHISWQGIENCETKVLTHPPPPEVPTKNFAPVTRNQIDQVNATVGQLLLFRVPEDTFYDHEDGPTRKLKMSLLNMDRSPLSAEHWLQFDSKNQEFFGLPMDKDVRREEYQLVCEDRAGLAATDGLVVEVRPRIQHRYNVEFSIALDVSYDTFVTSASMKRKFIEKLQELFEDSTTNAIVLGNIIQGSTVITWFNQSLPTDRCPEEEIHRLRKVLINDYEMMSDRLVSILGNEFTPLSVGLEPAGACQGELTVHHKPESPPPPIDESHPIGGSGSAEDYLVTFIIPTIFIAVMLILAGLIACFFYRKRRASKMGIGDEDERQSFRNKGIPVIFQSSFSMIVRSTTNFTTLFIAVMLILAGFIACFFYRKRRASKMGIGDEDERKSFRNKGIPVIFQDELEDKPEPENKNPVIMKEEKPPLPPPEYQRGHEMRGVGSEDTPYHPPPPFPSSRDSGRNARPKPTPTYRKPPPYVPP